MNKHLHAFLLSKTKDMLKCYKTLQAFQNHHKKFKEEKKYTEALTGLKTFGLSFTWCNFEVLSLQKYICLFLNSY